MRGRGFFPSLVQLQIISGSGSLPGSRGSGVSVAPPGLMPARVGVPSRFAPAGLNLLQAYWAQRATISILAMPSEALGFGTAGNSENSAEARRSGPGVDESALGALQVLVGRVARWTIGVDAGAGCCEVVPSLLSSGFFLGSAVPGAPTPPPARGPLQNTLQPPGSHDGAANLLPIVTIDCVLAAVSGQYSSVGISAFCEPPPAAGSCGIECGIWSRDLLEYFISVWEQLSL